MVLNELAGEGELMAFFFLIFNPSAWSDGHCPHTVNITCREVTGTARIQ